MASLTAMDGLSRGLETSPRVTSSVLRLDRTSVVPTALALTVIFAFGDWATGIDLTFTLLYTLPIGLASWFRSQRFGEIVAVLCAGSAAAAEVILRLEAGHHVHLFHLGWNHGGSLIIFLLEAHLVFRLRTYVDKERQGRRMAIEQLRHAERLNVIGKLAAGVAHELGTPINVIMALAELIAKDHEMWPVTCRRADEILNQASQMTTIIRHLLDFGRRGGTERTRVDLAALTREAVALLQPLARKHQATLVAATPREPVFTLGNRAELGQVVGNLVINAVQAMPSGGTVQIGCDVVDPQEGTKAHVGSPLVVVSVSDEGTGIHPDDLSRVFDPFFTTKDIGMGTGLGLSVSYGIVQDHGGSIRVDSRLGEGTRFTVTLPAA